MDVVRKSDQIWAFCLHGIVLEPVRNGSKTGPDDLQVQFWIRLDPYRTSSMNWFPGGGGGEGTLNKVLYREAPPRGPITRLYTIFDRKGTPFEYLPQKIVPLSYTYGATFTKLFT